MLLAIKLKNQILRASQGMDLPLEFKLKNIRLNDAVRGCSGFVRNTKTGSCVFVSTEHSMFAPLSEKSLYRYARDMADYSSNCLINGHNYFCLDEELPAAIVKLLHSGKGELKPV